MWENVVSHKYVDPKIYIYNCKVTFLTIFYFIQ